MTEAQLPARRPTAFRASRRGIALRRWRLQNFKSVRGAEVEFRPLTVVVGANSAGKSTLLQSIRAASQAIGTTGFLYPLNGRGVRLGTVEEVKYRGPGSDDEPLILGADFDVRTPRGWPRGQAPTRLADRQSPVLGTLSWEVKVGASPQQKGIAQIQRLNVDLKPATDDDDAWLSRAWILAIADETLVDDQLDDDSPASPRYFNGTFSGRTSSPLEVVDVQVMGGFPIGASVMRPRAEVLFEIWLADLLRRPSSRDPDSAAALFPEPESANRVINSLLRVNAAAESTLLDWAEAARMELLPGRGTAASRIDLNLATSEGFRHQVLGELRSAGVTGEVSDPHRLDDLGSVSSAAAEFLSGSIRYLGPLREEPHAAYPDSPEGDDAYVGPRGEFTASVLQRHGPRRVSVPVPDGEIRALQLRNAVNRWAEYFDIGQSFSVSDQGRFGIQLQMKQKDVQGELDLTSVGTGVSQLLPVIVMCLQAPVGALLLIEQPELHLNPKVQQRLADFLLAIARSGRNLIVETHSEYLISRLRRRVAEDPNDEVQDFIAIYFAERNEGATSYNLVETNEYGGIENWPENFFDQATDEAHATLSAAVKKRRARTSSDAS